MFTTIVVILLVLIPVQVDVLLLLSSLHYTNNLCCCIFVFFFYFISCLHSCCRSCIRSVFVDHEMYSIYCVAASSSSSADRTAICYIVFIATNGLYLLLPMNRVHFLVHIERLFVPPILPFLSSLLFLMLLLLLLLLQMMMMMMMIMWMDMIMYPLLSFCCIICTCLPP